MSAHRSVASSSLPLGTSDFPDSDRDPARTSCGGSTKMTTSTNVAGAKCAPRYAVSAARSALIPSLIPAEPRRLRPRLAKLTPAIAGVTPGSLAKCQKSRAQGTQDASG